MIKIAIDGLSGSGKGTLAEGLAKKFNLKHLDTGAIFRAIAVGFYSDGITELNDDVVEKELKKLNVEIKFDGNAQKMILNGKDVTGKLRDEPVSQMASKVSAFPKTREKYLEIVSEFSNNYDCVIDGRDITSIVLPDADVKIYLTADDRTRAERRHKENLEKNIPSTFDEVLANLQERDYRDTHRDIAPLIIVPEAFVVDNTNLNIEQTINHCVKFTTETLRKNGKI